MRTRKLQCGTHFQNAVACPRKTNTESVQPDFFHDFFCGKKVFPFLSSDLQIEITLHATAELGCKGPLYTSAAQCSANGPAGSPAIDAAVYAMGLEFCRGWAHAQVPAFFAARMAAAIFCFPTVLFHWQIQFQFSISSCFRRLFKAVSNGQIPGRIVHSGVDADWVGLQGFPPMIPERAGILWGVTPFRLPG